MGSVIQQMLLLGIIGAVIGAIIGLVASGSAGAVTGGIVGAIIGGIIGIPTGLVHRARMKVADETGLSYEEVRALHNRGVNEAFDPAKQSKK